MNRHQRRKAEKAEKAGRVKTKAVAVQAGQRDIISTVNLADLATAMRKVATAASSNIGSDCYIHAAIVQAILADYDVESKLIVGYTAWRTGPGSQDVITHAAIQGADQYAAGGLVNSDKALAYHVWLEIGDNIFDVTTYQLRQKMQELNDADGGNGVVSWCPDYLYVEKEKISTLRDVIQKDTGMFYYQHIPAVEDLVLSKSNLLDEDDVEMVRMLFMHPEIDVIGPNQINF